jgi:hypothetical protein
MPTWVAVRPAAPAKALTIAAGVDDHRRAMAAVEAAGKLDELT